LIAFRAVQGVGAGGLMSLALAIVGDVIPPRDRGRYQGYFGAVFGVSSVLGPLVGGLLVQIDWRWVFYVNLPVGILALIVVNRVLHLDHQRRKARIDWAGATLLVGGVSGILIAVQNYGSSARMSPVSWTFAAVGLVALLAFVWWEGRAAEPILPLRLFRNDVFRVTTSLSLITGAVMFGAIIFLPQYMQLVRGVSPTMSGLRLLPMLAGILFTSIGSGYLISKYGRYRGYVIGGTALFVLGTYLLTRIHVDTGFWMFSLILFVVGFSLGLFMQVTTLATQNSVDLSDMGVATSAVSFFRTLGGAIGSAVLGSILIAQARAVGPHEVAAHGPRLGPLYAFTEGMDRAYLWAIPVAVLAFVVALFLREAPLRTSNDPKVKEALAEMTEPVGAI
ncbi:MAG: MFS transporter, partial [Mycobacteriales bacterium]